MTPERPQAVTPWHIFLPIVLVVGVAMSIWGGFELERRGELAHKDKLSLESAQRMSELRSDWATLDGALGALPNLFAASQNVTQDEFAEVAHNLVGRFGFLKQLVVVTYPDQAIRYSGSMNVGADKRLLPEHFANLPKGLFVLGASTKKNATGVPYLVTAQKVEKNIKGLVLAYVDLQELLGSNMDQSSFAGLGLAIRIRPDGQAEDVYKATLRETDVPAGHDVVYEPSVETLANSTWTYTWAYDALKAVPLAWPGRVVMLMGVIITLIIFWALWAQHSVARRVRREVVERTNELEQASRRFRLITDNAYDLISIVNTECRYEYVNSAYNRVLGYARNEILQRNMLDIVHEEDMPLLKQAVNEVSAGRPVSEITFRMAHKSGGWIYMEGVAKGLFNSDWSLSNVVIHCRDVTSRKQYADDLARSEQRFRDFADSSADWLWEVDDKFQFTYVSPGIKGTLGYTPAEMIGKVQFKALFSQEDDSMRELVESRSQRRQPYRDLEFWTRTKMGERVCLRISAVPVIDEDGNFKGYRGAATNVTSSKLDQENMLRLATTDHLTGLLNRNRFMEELERTVALARRYDTQGVLLFVDLDRFKAVNDTHGHDAGDEIIRRFSDVLQKSMRQTDIIARLAGDEFAVIMHDIDVENARQKVQKLVETVNKLRIDYKGAKLQITMSVGMVSYPQSGRDASQLMTSADLAMYRAKEMGRNRMFVDVDGATTQVASSSIRSQLEWMDRLRHALDKDEFELHFQPIVPSRKNPLIFEALIRLRDEQGVLGMPGNFIDAAEHFGLIRQLDCAVIDRCVRTQAALMQKGMDPMLSINLSALSFGDAEVLKQLKASLKKHKARPESLIFEVTETAAMRDLNDAKAFVAELKDVGCKFALDDFGAGFSSFYYIKHLDIDFIKIDGSYIRHLDRVPEDRLFVRALVELANGLNIQTVAEFVENEEVLEELKRLKVDYLQGYYIDRPSADLEGMFEKFRNWPATPKKAKTG